MTTSTRPYSEAQTDALRELANIGAGNASIAMERLVGHPVDLKVPEVDVLPLADAVAAAGPPEADRYAIVVPVSGDFEARMLLLLDPASAAVVCGHFGLDAGTPEGHSMLCEFGNIMSSAYVCSLAQTIGMDVTPAPPQLVFDMLAAVFGAVLLGDGNDDDMVLVLDSELTVKGEPCNFDVMLLPVAGGGDALLAAIGI